MGLLDTVRPILGYVVAIAIILVLATSIGFMATVSATLVSSAGVMASLLVLIALMIGVAAASKASREV